MRSCANIKIITIAFVIAIGLGSSPVSAKQFTQTIHGKEVVVHTNALPVLLHRMVPPQHGRHVTQREIETGKIPQPTKSTSKAGILPRRK